MITTLRDRTHGRTLTVAAVVATVLFLAVLLGQRAAPQWLGALAAGVGGLALLAQPVLGLFALVAAALLAPLEIATGTEVMLNPVTILVPGVTMLWVLAMVRRRQIWLRPTAVNRPLLLFLAAGLFSLLIGRVAWDPIVPVRSNFLLVQLAQWAIFALSAMAFWLTAHLIRAEQWLWRLTAFFLLLGGGVILLRLAPGLGEWLGRFTTIAFIRAPFWLLLTGLAGGQLLWNRRLSWGWRIFLGLVLTAALHYAFVQQREVASNWVGLTTVLGVLIWLRFSRLRRWLVVLVGVLMLAGVLFPALYDFAGGDEEWLVSGGSRLALIERVVEVTMRNPITGLGPAAYRPYANSKPLPYLGAYWVAPLVNSHNNYVDLFAHGGILGLALFAWFSVEVARLSLRLRRRYTVGFAAGYVSSMLAVGAGALVIMLLADWMLPFVYNIGFPGFQASVLVWLFLGGLAALENMAKVPV